LAIVKFKPSLVGTVEDGAITTEKLADGAVIDIKIADNADIAQSKVKDLISNLANKVEVGPAGDGDKKVIKLGWKSSTGEFIIEHED